jgi:hypothetical protein
MDLVALMLIGAGGLLVSVGWYRMERNRAEYAT